MMTTQTYLVTADVAERTGLIQSRYRVKDGRYVVNDRDLGRIRLTTEEYIGGLQGVEAVSDNDAETLIADNSYQMGPAKEPSKKTSKRKKS